MDRGGMVQVHGRHWLGGVALLGIIGCAGDLPDGTDATTATDDMSALDDQAPEPDLTMGCGDGPACELPLLCKSAESRCFECLSGSDCSDPARPHCDPGGRCVACLPERDTCAVGAYCQGSGDGGLSAMCLPGCKSDMDCSPDGDGGLPDGGAPLRCDRAIHRCVGCLADADCPLGTLCQAGQCVPGCSMSHGCPAPKGCCQGSCVDFMVDTGNCGACGNVCAMGDPCCSGACRAIASDVNNCGGCGTVCNVPNAVASCVAGACAIRYCSAGFADCNNDPKDGCETDFLRDPQHCGSCFISCSGNHVVNQQCRQGQCTGPCVPGFGDCDRDLPGNGCEVDLGSDENNCGGCGVSCSANHVAKRTCQASTCTGQCSAGFADCNGNRQSDGCEIETPTNPMHCGGCGLACSSSHIMSPHCTRGDCDGSCDQGFGDCNNDRRGDGCEINTGSDVSNCGGCGMACSIANITRSCAKGSCEGGVCLQGFADCDGDKRVTGCEVDTVNDPRNCGGCGKTCSGTNVVNQTCAGGVCTSPCLPGFADCDGNKLTNGCEISLMGDVVNCGACRKNCVVANGVAACVGGACALAACNPGYLDCNGNLQDGCEVNPSTDASNCGQCGNSCGVGQVCVGRVCFCPGKACPDRCLVCAQGWTAYCAVHGASLCCPQGGILCDVAMPGPGCWPANVDCNTITYCPNAGWVACPFGFRIDCVRMGCV